MGQVDAACRRAREAVHGRGMSYNSEALVPGLLFQAFLIYGDHDI